MRSLLALIALALAVLVAGPRAVLAQDAPDEPTDIPVSVDVTIDDKDLATTGLFTIRIDCTAEADVGRAWSLAVELTSGTRTLLSWNHTPTPPTIQWKKGAKVHVDLPAPFPSEGVDPSEAKPLDVLLGFRNGATARVVPPKGTFGLRDGMAPVAQLTPPVFEPVVEPARIDGILAAAESLAQAGRKPDAWAALEFAIRAAPADAAKYRFRDAMVKLGDFAPRPITEVERNIVDDRIEDERRRYLREQAGRLRDQGKLHAALRILESIGGKLDEAANAAVVGALNDAKRAQKDLQDLREEIWEKITPEEKADVESVLKQLGRTKAALEKAREWAKAKRYAPARKLFKTLNFDTPKDVATAAGDDVKAMEKEWLATTPPDQQAACDAALRHPCFARTAVSLSHSFIFIGPKGLVDTIPAASRAQFDLAYIFITDVFGRRPNPEGDRVTVYFKELWDFGGGVGGGKIIDLGNAPPAATNMRVDNGLLFHELTHCVDDTKPIHHGFREGLADFGAAYAHEALGRAQEAQGMIARNLLAFQKDYLERDLEYWRIPNYAVSAGFLLSFAEKYAKVAGGHDWKGWRQFFREYRTTPVRDGREPYLARVLAHHLVRSFGPGAFDDLVAYRFPLVPSDRESVAKEAEKFALGDDVVAGSSGEFEEFPNSPMRRDLAARRAIEAHRAGLPDEARRIAREELGVVFDWHVIGPFEPTGADPGAQVFPPEKTIDLAAEYPQRQNLAKWRLVREPGPVEIDALGWVAIKYAYQDDTADYALTHVTVPAETAAFVHVRADDDFTLFVNDERIDGFLNRGWNDSTPLRWRGPIEHAPDGMRLLVKLRAGRNKILLKIRNRGGEAGFVLAVSRTDGRSIEGMVTDAEPPVVPPKPSALKPPPEVKWHSIGKFDFRTKGPLRSFNVVAGGFDVVNKLLAGTSTAKGVAWRKYTVRPGFPKDSPSNLMWIDAKLTDGLDDVRLTVRVQPPKDEAPKIAITICGEGVNDGLSGLNVLLWNTGGGKVAGQIERYEDLQVQWGPTEWRPKEKAGPAKDKEDADDLVLTWVDGRLTLTLAGTMLVDAASLRAIPGRTRIGISTWGAQPRIAEIELESTKSK